MACQIVRQSPTDAAAFDEHILTDGLLVTKPTLFLRQDRPLSDTYSFVASGTMLTSLPRWTACQGYGCTFGEDDWSTMERDLAAGEVFFSLLTTQLFEFSLFERTGGAFARHLFGDDTELRRVITRLYLSYRGGRLQRITFLAALGAYSIRLPDSSFVEADAAPGLLKPDGRLSLEQRRDLVLWYRRAGATHQTLVISFIWPRSSKHAGARPAQPVSVALRNQTRENPVCCTGWNVIHDRRVPIIEPDADGAPLDRHLVVLEGPRASTAEQVNAIRAVLSSLPADAGLAIVASPYNHLYDERLMDQLTSGAHLPTFSRTEPIARFVGWRRAPDYDRKFYVLFAALVSTVAALSSLGLPVYVYDELVMWSGLGTLLLERWRIEAIRSTLDSCRRVRAARDRAHNATN